MTKPLEDQPAAPALAKEPSQNGQGRRFRDKVYTSRTLILPSGNALPVAQGRVSGVSDEQIKYLTAHPDFEPMPE